MTNLSFKNLSKSYGDVEVLHGINLEVYSGEFLVFVGPSGCGKSTLLRMIAGLEDVTDGQMYIENQMVNNIQPSLRGVAMVFQSYALYPHMTVYKNMSFGLQLSKAPKDEIIKKVNNAAKILKLTDYLERYPKQLSGGQRQRVAIGRAIVRDPKVFLFDEPLSNLDAALRGQTRIEIAKLHASLKSTMIYVTHDQVEAMTLADRIVVMNEGIIEQVGTPEELYSAPKNIFVGSFIGSPPMNFIPGKIKNGAFNSDQIQSFNVSINTEADVILGIRPDDLHIGDNNSYDFKAELYASEFLGEGYLITFNLGNSKLLLKSQKNIEFKTKERIPILIDKNKFLLFDYNSKKRIYW